jgi:hypothetical protein
MSTMSLPFAEGYGLILDTDAVTLERTLKRVVESLAENVIRPRLLEVGIGGGFTSRGIMRYLESIGCTDVDYWCVDSGSCGLTKPPFEGARIVVGDSSEVYDQVPGEFDWCFIDACHCRNHTTLDFFNYSPKVRVGGFLLFHDTTDRERHSEYQGHGPSHLKEFHIDCRAALEQIGLLGNYLPNWRFIEDSRPETLKDGGVCVFQRVNGAERT